MEIKGKKSLFLLNRVVSLKRIQGILGEMNASTYAGYLSASEKETTQRLHWDSTQTFI